jgi:hypothetical protein
MTDPGGIGREGIVTATGGVWDFRAVAAETDFARVKTAVPDSGTDGSNPLPSSKESANHRFLHAGLPALSGTRCREFF